MPLQGTKDRLLDAAERLFASDGLGRTSLRAITCEAGTNVAAVHYHFGSKTDLLVALLQRRIAPLNEERLARLGAIEERHTEGPLPLEPVLRAFIEPAFRFRSEVSDSQNLGRLFARLYAEREEALESTLRENFESVALRFRAALSRTTPHLSTEEFDWRFRFVVGALVHTLLRDAAGDGDSADGPTAAPTSAEAVEQLIAFTGAGLRAPSHGVDP